MPGDRVLVRPGDKVPIDGVIVKGRSHLNEAMLTGESRPVERGEGEEAIGGAINGEGALTLEVRKTGDQTYLAQVIALVRQAQESRSRTQDVANRAAQWLTWIALGRWSDALHLAGARRRDPVRGRAHGDGHGHRLPACAWGSPCRWSLR